MSAASEFHTHGFGPVYDQNSRILILGSFPSVKSRAVNFYYGHPKNRFWPLISKLTGEPLPESTEEKRALVLKHGIALWDSIESCEITGSSDASIKNVVPVDISLITSAAQIRIIACNGAASRKYYDKYLRDITGQEAVKLPSTSPANAAWSFDRLFEAWHDALGEYLDPDPPQGIR